MFDTPPSNLPFAPEPKPDAALPPFADPSPKPNSTSSGRMEPEDIFSGVDDGVGKPPKASGPTASDPFAPKKASPLKTILIVLGVLFGLGVLGVIGVWVALTMFAKQAATTLLKSTTTTPLANVQPTTSEPSNTVETTTPPPVSTNSQTEQPTSNPTNAVPPESTSPPVTSAPAGTQIPLPTETTPPATPATTPIIRTEGIDSDGDGLTDAEETIFGTNPSLKDTDGDVFSDGSEIQGLYDPLVKGAMLEKSDKIVRQVIRGQAFLLPSVMQSLVAQSSDGMVIQLSPTAQIVVKGFDRPSTTSIDAWLTQQNIVAPKTLKTKSGMMVRQTDDGLRTFVAVKDAVIEVDYDLGDDTSFNYRALYQLIWNSLKFA